MGRRVSCFCLLTVIFLDWTQVNGRRMGPVLSAFVYDVFRQEDGRATILEPEEETETEEGDTT